MSSTKCLNSFKIKRNVIAGDVFSTDWDTVLNGATAVVSTLGGFGTNEQMEKLNGDANVLAVRAASEAGNNDSRMKSLRCNLLRLRFCFVKSN